MCRMNLGFGCLRNFASWMVITKMQSFLSKAKTYIRSAHYQLEVISCLCLDGLCFFMRTNENKKAGLKAAVCQQNSVLRHFSNVLL